MCFVSHVNSIVDSRLIICFSALKHTGFMEQKLEQLTNSDTISELLCMMEMYT